MQTSSKRAKGFLGPFFSCLKNKMQLLFDSLGQGCIIFHQAALWLSKSKLSKWRKVGGSKKICPRNPLAIVDGVCLYNSLKFTEKMKSIISGGYFANAFLRVVWSIGQHMLPSDWYQWYRIQIISAMFSLTDCVASESDPSCSFDLITLRKFNIWNMGGVKNFGEG